MSSTSPHANKKKGMFLPALCNVLGALLILAVFVLALPVTAPRLFGYEAYNVISGSMEPSIPVDSVIYVHSVDPEEIEVDDVIAFNDGDSVIAHRVVVNRATMGEFVTKGDANNAEDPNPVPYEALVGRVELNLPFLGKAMALYASNVGKLYLVLTFACGVMLNILAERMREQRRVRQLQEAKLALERAAQSGEAVGELGVSVPTQRRSHTGRTIVMGILAAIFICSGGVVGYVTLQHHVSDKAYGDASHQYTKPVDAEVAQGEKKGLPTPPIQIDFEALRAVNPDIVGWIYCADTPIDYPVLLGDDNDQYLHHDYTGAYNIDGSIFLDSSCKGDFSLANTIIYGHHMGYTGSMFTCLKFWADQPFYDEHPVMWLLTPTQDYRVDLFSGHHTEAGSSVYTVFDKPSDELNTYLQEALDASLFTAKDVKLKQKGHYVVLSTCAYIFDNARFVMHGLLTPVPSEAGVPRS